MYLEKILNFNENFLEDGQMVSVYKGLFEGNHLQKYIARMYFVLVSCFKYFSHIQINGTLVK